MTQRRTWGGKEKGKSQTIPCLEVAINEREPAPVQHTTAFLSEYISFIQRCLFHASHSVPMLRNTAQRYLYTWVMEKRWLGGFRATGLCPMLGNSSVPFWPAERKIKRKEGKKGRRKTSYWAEGMFSHAKLSLN